MSSMPPDDVPRFEWPVRRRRRESWWLWVIGGPYSDLMVPLAGMCVVWGVVMLGEWIGRSFR